MRFKRTADQFVVPQKKARWSRLCVSIWCNSLWTQLCAYLLLSLVLQAAVVKQPWRSCIWKHRHLLCGHFGKRDSQISFTAINKLLWLIRYAACVPILAHNTVIYSWRSPAMRAVDELGIRPEDSHFSSLTKWTSAGRNTSLQFPRMAGCRPNRDGLSVHFLLGHNMTESWPFEKDNITDITFRGGSETRARN